MSGADAAEEDEEMAGYKIERRHDLARRAIAFAASEVDRIDRAGGFSRKSADELPTAARIERRARARRLHVEAGAWEWSEAEILYAAVRDAAKPLVKSALKQVALDERFSVPTLP